MEVGEGKLDTHMGNLLTNMLATFLVNTLLDVGHDNTRLSVSTGDDVRQQIG